jgi:UDP-2,3-diacylglucosamine pyrophosphatase LpxH
LIVNVQAEKLVVISDLHLGNPFSKDNGRILRFLSWACDNDYDICINGDGLEIAQVSFSRLAKDVPDLLQLLRKITGRGRTVYYVVGNHDIAMENFLDNWGGFVVTPFLNVQSGAKRIRIEHGHLYDPFFVKHPKMYEFVTWFAGFFLMALPTVYKVWISFERFKSKLKGNNKSGIPGEPRDFLLAAEEVSRRGFDAVVFGHTHHQGHLVIEGGRDYFNTGSWLLEPRYLEIVAGEGELKLFEG